MKATQLRLGNIVRLQSDPELIDHVLILEPGLVHLESGTDYEDEGNVGEVPIREPLLSRFGIPAKNWFYLGGIRIYIGLVPGGNFALVHIGNWVGRIKYMHELQNIIHDITGQELILHPNIHAPYGEQ